MANWEKKNSASLFLFLLPLHNLSAIILSDQTRSPYWQSTEEKKKAEEGTREGKKSVSPSKGNFL